MQLIRPAAVSLVAVLCLATAVSSASIQPSHIELSQPPSSWQLSARSDSNGGYAPSAPLHQLYKRHGDHGDDEDEEEDEHEHAAMAHDNIVHKEEHIPVAHEHEHMHEDVQMSSSHSHADEHSHDHGHEHTHKQAIGPSPASVPDAAIAGPELLALPVWHSHGGHGHSHGSGAAKEHLNETSLFIAKGPDPLSYVEWDFGYSLGSAAQLRRFMADADVLAGTEKMGVVDGRWRKLFDERQPDQRKAIASDIASRLPEGEGEPSRHRGLLVLHVLTAVLSCFVLLPMALVLKAGHSTLAPLASLLYLVMLGGSMFISIIYKALTPRLYPDNAHGSMGWAILWISVITLGSDVFRVVGQIWTAVSALRSNKRGNIGLPTTNTSTTQSWRDIVGIMSGRGQHHSETYDALEEEAMLSEEAQSDAQELDVEKHLHQHLSSARRSAGSPRSGSGSGSPHRVHFDEPQRARGGSTESLAEPVEWQGSGSTVTNSRHGSPRTTEQMFGGGDRMVASPTTTACNTPRNSMFGGEAFPNLKSVSLWRKQAHADQSAAVHDDVPAGFAPVQARSSRLATLRTIWKYTRVVAARSLPVLAFATSYTGLAVYTGSCRGGYKNVCLAHGIKGGIFFWFGLLTFGRYLGAYADIGWAWNKRPTAQGSRGKKSLAGWRRNAPSAEFVECLVIFVYGASNTWMERFGAQPGDPYTIKQIQHISIAVMFWFAGLMGMLLETKFIRNMLSFPIAYHHVAALPMQEVRHRRSNQSRARVASRNADEGADSDLDLLVEAQTQPASYSSSFNPFPALVIGVTGVAMAAHHQDYVYEVQIHMLWGQLLAGFALLRCLTYFLLWLRPPSASVLPSRPPTEALAAFSLCCGGLVFMLSSEEVSFAAMRSGYGDFMAILNVAVAVVALLFCWTTGLMMLKGWAVRREVKKSLYEPVESRSMGMASNALQLNVEEEERGPRHMRANVVNGSGAAQTLPEVEPVFVLDDEDDEDTK